MTAMGVESKFEPFFGTEKGLVWAADVKKDEFKSIMQQIGGVDGLVGVKIGFQVGLGLSLPTAVDIVRTYSDAKILYDHQKAGNDIPDTSENFLETMMDGGVDGAILFPFTGPETQEAWTRALQREGLGVFTGSEMTHKRFRKAEGGSIADTSMRKIIDLALVLGVNDFIVPGNKPKSVEKWRKRIEAVRGLGGFALAAPGFVDQGGNVTEAAAAAGELWHPIMGRGIHANPALKPSEAVQFYSQLLKEAA